MLVGQPDQAAEALERALKRKPPRNDLLEIFQALGRVYQRTQKAEQALAVWSRLEGLFPDDTRVKEQIATALTEEDQPALALPRFEALARTVKDPFRQVQLAMQAAELKVRLNRTEEALNDFEAMLAKLRPDSWLHKEVRRKIEEVFLRNDDRAGLVDLLREVDEAGSRRRRGPGAAGPGAGRMGRIAEAQPWFEKAIKLAPGRRELRLALIGQLAAEQKYAEAAAQYEALDRSEPNNPDTLKDWGVLVMRDANRPLAERKAAASAIWRKLLETKPNDAVTSAQVADMLRQIELVDESLALYRKAAQQAPGNPQYREYLGEYLHQLKRHAEAMAEWSKIVEGPNRNAKNLGRLAEVLAGFGYVKEAIGAARGGGRARQGRLRPADEAGGAVAPAGAIRRRRGPARRRRPGWRARTRRRRPPRSARQERPGGRRDRRRGSPRYAASSRAIGGRRPGAGPSWRGISRPTASCPRPSAPPTAPSRSSRDRSRPGRWPPACASRPATWATPPMPSADSPRSTARTAPSTSPASRGSSRGWVAWMPRSRPAATCWPPRRATPSITSSSLSSASSSAGRRRAWTPSAARCGSTPTTPRSS